MNPIKRNKEWEQYKCPSYVIGSKIVNCLCGKCKPTPTTPQPDWSERFEEKYYQDEQYKDEDDVIRTCRIYTKPDGAPAILADIKSFIEKVESESYERGKEEGYKEGLKQGKDCCIHESHGMTGGYKKGLEELNK